MQYGSHMDFPDGDLRSWFDRDEPGVNTRVDARAEGGSDHVQQMDGSFSYGYKHYIEESQAPENTPSSVPAMGYEGDARTQEMIISDHCIPELTALGAFGMHPSSLSYQEELILNGIEARLAPGGRAVTASYEGMDMLSTGHPSSIDTKRLSRDILADEKRLDLSPVGETRNILHCEFGVVPMKSIKGVYKNCRGIWAAQWTDDNGQRHTKYFNPKNYSSEEAARVAAFRFRMAVTATLQGILGSSNRSTRRRRCRTYQSQFISPPSLTTSQSPKQQTFSNFRVRANGHSDPNYQSNESKGNIGSVGPREYDAENEKGGEYSYRTIDAMKQVETITSGCSSTPVERVNESPDVHYSFPESNSNNQAEFICNGMQEREHGMPDQYYSMGGFYGGSGSGTSSYRETGDTNECATVLIEAGYDNGQSYESADMYDMNEMSQYNSPNVRSPITAHYTSHQQSSEYIPKRDSIELMGESYNESENYNKGETSYSTATSYGSTQISHSSQEIRTDDGQPYALNEGAFYMGSITDEIGHGTQSGHTDYTYDSPWGTYSSLFEGYAG